MGFGLLLIGYIFSFVATIGLGEYMFAGMLLGGFIMYLGLCELRRYCPTFLYALIGSILIILCSVYKAGVWIDGWMCLELPVFSSPAQYVFNWIKIALYFIFDITMLYGIADLSQRVDYPETKEKAFRNMAFVVVFNLFQLLTFMPFITSLDDENRNTVMTLLMIFQAIYSIINTLLIFKCYAMICPAGQEEMPRKPSRFEFVNKMRAIRDAKEEKAIEEAKNYFEEKLRKKNAKKKSKHKKK